MPCLLVTPLSTLPAAIQFHAPSHLVSLLSPEHMIKTPEGYDAASHLKLEVNDIVDPTAGIAPPNRNHVEKLLEFSRNWDARQPLLIHCWAGISRSMACAFTILCDRAVPEQEMQIAHAIRKRAPHAQPNRLFVKHADDALGRGGRMVAALNSMGPPLTVEEGVLTVFPLVGL